jgi:hypothetical protein
MWKFNKLLAAYLFMENTLFFPQIMQEINGATTTKVSFDSASTKALLRESAFVGF